MDTNSIGKNLSVILKGKGMTQHDLAERIELPDSTISLWVHGKRKPYGEQRKKICQILSIEESQLFLSSPAVKQELSSFGPMFS